MGGDNPSNATPNSAAAPSTPGQVQSVIQIANENNAAAQQQIGFVDQILQVPQAVELEVAAAQKTAAYTQHQFQQLSGDVQTQSAPSFSGHNYASYTATQLKQMVTTNMDPVTAGDASTAWTSIGNSYVQVSQSLSQAVGNSEYGWQGSTGDATRDFMTGIAKWAGTAGQGAQLAGNRLAVQSEAATTAKNSVPTNPTEPPTGSDVASTMLDNFFNPAAGAAKLNAQFTQAASDHTEAVQAAQTYDSALASSGEKFPAFNTPPTFNPNAGSGTVTPTGGGSGVSGLNRAGNVSRGGGGSGGVVRSAPRGGGAPSGGQAPPNLTTPSSSSSTSTAGFQPGGTTSLPNTNPGQLPGGPGGSGGQNGLGWNPDSNIDPTFSGTLLGAGGGAGAIGGSGGFGSGPAGLSSGTGSVSAGAGGSGARSGIGSGAAGEEAEGGLGGAKSASEPSEGGMAPRGGGKGKGGEDAEHKRADYLLNSDPYATFGTDERVAPPVIGE
ncbi:MAG TPA: hypothetical protein VHX38_25685 [Pseudonocardiaceae bacterium]|jgi:hypothetical protein|nr:hypothetical protein [Pseudonocardiaceae bacterium]